MTLFLLNKKGRVDLTTRHVMFEFSCSTTNILDQPVKMEPQKIQYRLRSQCSQGIYECTPKETLSQYLETHCCKTQGNYNQCIETNQSTAQMKPIHLAKLEDYSMSYMMKMSRTRCETIIWPDNAREGPIDPHRWIQSHHNLQPEVWSPSSRGVIFWLISIRSQTTSNAIMQMPHSEKSVHVLVPGRKKGPGDYKVQQILGQSILPSIKVNELEVKVYLT